jgi:membrane-bound lytic murein transglycosylase D
VHVPSGLGPAIRHRLAARGGATQVEPTVIVRRGDTPESVARRLRGEEGDLRQLNAIGSDEALAPGTLLLVPLDWVASTGSREAALRPDSEDVVVLPPDEFAYPDRERVFYRTLHGDDLGAVARALGVSQGDLVLWNRLDPRARLQADMVLQAYVESADHLDGIRLVAESSAGKRLRSGSPAFLDHFEAERGRKRLQILARDGDTLRSIGLRYGLSAGMMERINHLPRNQRLTEGHPIVVYARYGPVPSEVLLSRAPDPLPPVDPPHPHVLPTAP